jgi:hypothetical protein
MTGARSRLDASVSLAEMHVPARDDAQVPASAPSSRPRFVRSECVRSTNTCGMSERRHYGPLEVRIIDQARGANLDLAVGPGSSRPWVA